MRSSRGAVVASSSRARYDVILASSAERWRLRARHRRPVTYLTY